MIEVAKLDSNNKIVNTFAIHKAYGKDATGTITQSKIKEYCVATFGGTADEYLGNLPNIGGTANKDDFYDADKNCFHGGRPLDMAGSPCSSWTLNAATGQWEPPHNYVRQLDDGADFNYENVAGEQYGIFAWREETNSWYAKKHSEYKGGNTSAAYYKFDNTDKTWKSHTDF